MIRETVLVAMLCTVAVVASSGSIANEPMVAFVCNRPAMHRTSHGWVRDETTGCITDPIDILSYCRKTYSDRDVWNVVESNEMVTIKNWCNFGHTKCRHRFTVRPFRCLVGPFQSEALQVPDKCVFDHVHGPGAAGGADCQSSAEWNQTARQACTDRHGAVSQLHGFAVLQPCGINGFGGVEFVCCPSSAVAEATSTQANAAAVAPSRGHHHHGRRTTRVRPEMTSTVTRPTTTTTTTTTTPAPTTRTSTLATTTTTESQTTPSVSNDDDVDDDEEEEDEDAKEEVVTRAHAPLAELQPIEGVSVEYDWFSQAKAELEKRHHEKVTKMMREWAAARKRVQEIKSIDIKGGEKFNREMTARFQKAYESLEHDTASERKKLVSEHQKRVEDALNKKKTQAMEIYTAAINSPHTDATKVLNALVQYVKTEQKDRVHTINYYERIEESDPVEAESQRSSVAAHLRGIDQRVTRAIEMLSRLPKYEKKIRQQIEKFLSSYQSLDESLAVIMAKINEKTNGNRPLQPIKQQDDDFLLTSSVSSATDDVLHEDFWTTRPVSEEGVDTTTPETSTGTVKQTRPVAATGTVQWTTTLKPSVSEHQRRFVVDVKPVVQHASHNMKNDITVLESYIKKLPLHADTSGHVAAPLAIVAVGAALFVVVLAGVAFVRRRSLLNDPSSMDAPGSSNRGDGSVAGKPAKGVPAGARVPINGYENPTYQYYAHAEIAARQGAAVAAGES